MNRHWVPGNRITLLENGEGYFPRVFDAIATAEREVLLETFILFDDKVGRALQQALLRAAGRGAEVHVLVDGWGSPDLPPSFTQPLLDAGVKLRSFEPAQRLFGARINMLRRMHRKLVVVDRRRAFVGGINYSIDHLDEHGPLAKQDYAIEIEGPLVGQIQAFCRASLERPQPARRLWLRRWRQMRDKDAGQDESDAAAARDGVRAAFVTRDNRGNRTDIERHYRAAVRSARERILIANAYFFPGYRLLRDLRQAARRGVQVDLTLDGWGSIDLSEAYLGALANAGVKVRMFDPRPRFLGMRLHMFRRMHRKIVVVDGEIAFAGGINFSADHLADFGPEAKQDYSVSLRGPLVPQIRRYVLLQIGRGGAGPGPTGEHAAKAAGDMEAMLVVRDNQRNRDSIERHYRAAIRAARKQVIIANAYFFPGYRLLKSMRHAVQRGVRVCLILQGQPDMKIVKHAAELLHGHLISAGVEIYEYCKRPLHGKVAVIDDEWATVGSSNLDPLSLSLNLEANVMIRSRAFNLELCAHFEALMKGDCRRLEADQVASRRRGWRILLDTLAYHVTRLFPAWAGYLPAHSVPLKLATPGSGPQPGGEAAWRPH